MLTQKKSFLQDWIHKERIPGKVQAWFSVPLDPQLCDFRLIQVQRGSKKMLSIEATVPKISPPVVVLEIYEQLRKEHLQVLRNSISQIWFRAIGEGSYALLIQANINTSLIAKAYKSFLFFLKKTHPEILCCHRVQSATLFDPSNPYKARLKLDYGPTLLPLADSPFYFHILDWTPYCKSTWLKLPERIKNFIHPSKDDCLLEFHAASAYIGASLAPYFKSVDTVDSFEYSKISAQKNASKIKSLYVHQEVLNEKFLQNFFSKQIGESKWTILLNPPTTQRLNRKIISILVGCRPERILLITGDLESASKNIKAFRQEGFMLRKTLPIDTNPNSNHFELAFLFVPDRANLLGKVKLKQG